GLAGQPVDGCTVFSDLGPFLLDNGGGRFGNELRVLQLGLRPGQLLAEAAELTVARSARGRRGLPGNPTQPGLSARRQVFDQLHAGPDPDQLRPPVLDPGPGRIEAAAGPVRAAVVAELLDLLLQLFDEAFSLGVPETIIRLRPGGP